MLTIKLGEETFQSNTLVTTGTYANVQFYKLISDLISKGKSLTVFTSGCEDADLFSIGLLSAIPDGEKMCLNVTCIDSSNIQDNVLYEMYENMDDDSVLAITSSTLKSKPALLHVDYPHSPCIMNHGVPPINKPIRPSILPCIRLDRLFEVSA